MGHPVGLQRAALKKLNLLDNKCKSNLLLQKQTYNYIFYFYMKHRPTTILFYFYMKHRPTTIYFTST